MPMDAQLPNTNLMFRLNRELEAQLDSHQLSLVRLQTRYEEIRAKEAEMTEQLKTQAAELEVARGQMRRLSGMQTSNHPTETTTSTNPLYSPLQHDNTNTHQDAAEMQMLRMELKKAQKKLVLKTEDFDYVSTQNRDALNRVAEAKIKAADAEVKATDAQNYLAATQNELHASEDKLFDIQNELDVTQKKLNDAQHRMTGAQTKATDAQIKMTEIITKYNNLVATIKDITGSSLLGFESHPQEN